ncbi:polysaccharide deacetylase family protein [Sediminibacillus massiliensis]|uniref:polysaccharide deacetylase family protein n=1 Tax=Sediminibacillus massiliensis TaxID=1926277 RepID=UPI0009887397|nr:polysaccharide deacetylase family protein [Sediminibacillus massiliensis]
MYDSTDDVITKSATEGKKVVLTFDDGPGKHLSAILDILKQEGVQAMFFWQARLLYPERPWLRVIEEGHTIGTHTLKHRNLAKLSYQQQLLDLKQSVNEIESITGTRVAYFRPPFGQYNQETLRAAEELGLETVMWKIASIDWELKNTPEQIVSNVADHLQDGAIILLHELKQTVEVLPELIQTIRKKGFEFTILNKS